jgi:hypothetical protein
MSSTSGLPRDPSGGARLGATCRIVTRVRASAYGRGGNARATRTAEQRAREEPCHGG